MDILIFFFIHFLFYRNSIDQQYGKYTGVCQKAKFSSVVPGQMLQKVSSKK